MKKKYFISVLYVISSFTCISQSEKFRHQILDGYFVLLRDSIPKTTSEDIIAPRKDFHAFYVKTLNDTILDFFQKNDTLKSHSLVFVSGGISSAIATSIEHQLYIQYLIDNNLFEKAHDYAYYPFKLETIPEYLINGDSRFLAIYKGKITVVGDFVPYTKLQHLINSKLYMYLPLETNLTKYLYSIVY